MDGVHVMKRETFYQILLHCLPSSSRGGGEKQGKQLALPFWALPWDSEIHAVVFVHRATRFEFEWVKPEGCPAELPFYMLISGDCQQIAKRLSCHQLFWETGILGQVLYLEAHAVGISATGIGCYFDDAEPCTPSFDEGAAVVPQDIIDEGIAEWEEVLIRYFLDKRMSFPIVKNALEKAWKLKGSMDITTYRDLFYISFSASEDKQAVLEGGPIFIAGKIFVVMPWLLEAESQRNNVSTVPIWAKL
ncbi:hypothetical protein IFM89_030508 [Coptis chinensis]|uniref:DUF4283 domain-containing protein n=1 Tax=Coptis chinensis TaxID=261450 RepID=A0A835LPH2_9MAGN|nr:hypothetical protein IFM89_030508 [Coptis chinensis]